MFMSPLVVDFDHEEIKAIKEISRLLGVTRKWGFAVLFSKKLEQGYNPSLCHFYQFHGF